MRYKYAQPAARTVPFTAAAPGAPTTTRPMLVVKLKNTDRDTPNMRFGDRSSTGFSVWYSGHVVPLSRDWNMYTQPMFLMVIVLRCGAPTTMVFLTGGTGV